MGFKTVDSMEFSSRPQGFNEIKTEHLNYCNDVIHTARQFFKWFSLTLLREVEQRHINFACRLNKRASTVDNINIVMYYIMSKHKKYRSTETDNVLYVS